jgi:hypothetical protein
LTEPWCKADDVSFEVDSVRFYSDPSSAYEGLAEGISLAPITNSLN